MRTIVSWKQTFSLLVRSTAGTADAVDEPLLVNIGGSAGPQSCDRRRSLCTRIVSNGRHLFRSSAWCCCRFGKRRPPVASESESAITWVDDEPSWWWWSEMSARFLVLMVPDFCNLASISMPESIRLFLRTLSVALWLLRRIDSGAVGDKNIGSPPLMRRRRCRSSVCSQMFGIIRRLGSMAVALSVFSVVSIVAKPNIRMLCIQQTPLWAACGLTKVYVQCIDFNI